MTPLPDPGVPRRRRLAVLTLGLAFTIAAALGHAHAARSAWATSQQARRDAVHLVGNADLALSSTSRWLRSPSLAEPGAPFADAPAVLDQDPAGGLLAPPRAHFRRAAGGAVTVKVRRHPPTPDGDR